VAKVSCQVNRDDFFVQKGLEVHLMLHAADFLQRLIKFDAILAYFPVTLVTILDRKNG